MKKFVFAFLFLFCGIVNAQERLKMAIPSDEEGQVNKLLENLTSSINNEDYKSYSSLLTKEFASKGKKKTVMMFMKHDLHFDAEKFTIMECDNENLEFILSYTLTADNVSSEIVSSIKSKRTDNGLLISNESIISENKIGGNNNAIAANNRRPMVDQQADQPVCKDGLCPLQPPVAVAAPVRKAKRNDQGQEVLGGVAMFNDANGNPDPNGIMWLDPKKLLQMFPEKYGVPPCANGNCPR
jgi:hypothetical protein